MEAMSKMKDNAYDICITDPPYNVGYKYNSYEDELDADEYKNWCKNWFLELERVVSGCILISCGHVNVGMWYDIKKPKWLLCWHKPAAMGRSSVGFCNFEPVLFYGKTGKQSVDVFKAPIIPDDRMDFHSCPKPVRWAEMQLHNYAKEGWKVLDIFGGSFTTAIACHNLGYSLDLWELDEDYYKAGVKRFNQHKQQLRIF